MWDMFYRLKDKFMERSAFFLTLFALSPVQNQIFAPSNVLTSHLKYEARYYSEFQERYLWILLATVAFHWLDAWWYSWQPNENPLLKFERLFMGINAAKIQSKNN